MMFAPRMRISRAALALGLLLLFTPATASPRVAPQLGQRAAGSVWVTVDAVGNAQTITPLVTSANGAATTLYTAPPRLVATGTYVLSPSGQQTTSTGIPPVASPTGTTQAGVFLFCDSYQAESPFCEPRRGSLLNPGMPYYVTWSSETFANKSTMVKIQGDYHNGTGFTSLAMPVTKGFWTWSIDPNSLNSLGQSPLSVTLSLAYLDPGSASSNRTEIIQTGPTVYVTNQLMTNIGAAASRFNASTIALPVVLGFAVLATIGVCCWRWNKGKKLLPFGNLGLKPSSMRHGYGIRHGRADRVGPSSDGWLKGSDDKAVPGVAIQLTDRESWSPTRPAPTNAGMGAAERQPGRNVFREELRRQERQK